MPQQAFLGSTVGGGTRLVAGESGPNGGRPTRIAHLHHTPKSSPAGPGGPTGSLPAGRAVRNRRLYASLSTSLHPVRARHSESLRPCAAPRPLRRLGPLHAVHAVVSSQARVVACLSTPANALRSATAHFLLRFSCPLRFIVPQCPPWNRLRPHGDRHSSGSRPSDPGDPARLSNPGPRHIQSHRVRRSVVFGHDDLPHLHYSPVLLNATSNPLALLLRTTETGR